jgi:hypothetical protein
MVAMSAILTRAMQGVPPTSLLKNSVYINGQTSTGTEIREHGAEFREHATKYARCDKLFRRGKF